MRIALFGGSFDPVHWGHLLLAETCREQRELDRVVFMPAGAPPHKQGLARTAGDLRAMMLELATVGQEAFEVDRYEIDKGGLSYTIETLRRLRAEYPDDELYFLVGADMFVDLPNWRDAEEILRIATPIGVQRPGCPAPEIDALAPLIPDRADLDRIGRMLVDMPQVDLSSTDIRLRVERGRSIRYRTPRAVEEFIHSHGLYRAS